MLSNFSIKRPITILMVVLGILVLGAVSLTGLNIDLMPSLSMPVAVVVTEYPGAGPAEVETMVTKPVEQAVATAGGVESMQSMSSMGQSIVIAQFGWNTDMDFAALDLREKVDLIKGYLPADAQDPMVLQMDPNILPVLQLGISGDLPPAEMNQIVEDTIAPRLERIDGVAQVNVLSSQEREIKVRLLPAKLNAYGLDPMQVVQVLQASNLNFSSGDLNRGSQELLVRVNGEFQSVSDIENMPLVTPSGGQIKLKDLAVVEDGLQDQDSLARVNGNEAIGITISKSTTANTVDVVQKARAVLAELSDEIPGELQVATVLDQAEYVEMSVNNVISNLFFGGILAIVILFIFLRNFRTTLIIGAAMPISVIVTFVLIYFNDMTLNMMTLGGLALGIGMMVDNGIVVVENIFRHREEEGEAAIEAAMNGANEVATAITASTLTTVAVFFPIAFVEGMASELFSDLSFTVGFALFASLLVALTFIPMLASRFLGISFAGTPAARRGALAGFSDTVGGWLEALNNVYRAMLSWCLKHRAATLGIVTALLVTSGLLTGVIGTEFIPSMDQGQVTAEITMAHGTSLEEADRVVSAVEKVFLNHPDADVVYSSVGSNASGMAGLSSFTGSGGAGGRIDLTLKPLGERLKSTEAVARELEEQVGQIAGAEIKITPTDIAAMMMGAFMAPVQLTFKGDDLAVLDEIASRAVDLVEDVPGIKDIGTSLEEARPEIQIKVDKDKAMALGLTPYQVGSAVRLANNGQLATLYREGGKEYDVVVSFDEGAISTVADLESLKITSPAGFKVPLGDIAAISETMSPVTIERQDQARVVSVTTELDGTRSLGEVMADVEDKLNNGLSLPPGYEVIYGGENEMMTESFQDLGMALALAIVLIYMIMAAQFESLLQPLIIMFSMPVAAVGVILGLVLTGQTFSVLAFVGIIILAGIVVNNAIVLIDYTNQLRARGMERTEALLKAGPTRLRPILMTALTTIFAMIPLALGIGGEGAEIQKPMAVVVIGGLASSTFLTLLFVPVIYSLFDDLSRRLTAIFTKNFKAEDQGEVKA